jgi:hypothetical protein
MHLSQASRNLIPLRFKNSQYSVLHKTNYHINFRTIYMWKHVVSFLNFFFQMDDYGFGMATFVQFLAISIMQLLLFCWYGNELTYQVMYFIQIFE